MSAGLRAIVVALTLMVAGAFLPPTVVRSGAVLGAKSGLQARISEQRTLQLATPLLAKKDSNKESDVIEVDGIVKESLPNAKFRVELVATKAVIVCSTSGKMRKNFVRVLVGDPVKVELSPYDLTRGRITYRSRTGKAPPPPPNPEASS